MGRANCVMTVRGEFLKETTARIGIRLILFRNDEKNHEKFEINIELPCGLYTIKRYEDEIVASNEYKQMSEAIQKSKKAFL